MTYNIVNIILGIIILYGASYGLILLYTYLYLKYLARQKKIAFVRIALSAAPVSLAWLLSTFLTIWFATSVNLLFFAVFSLVLFFVFTLLLSEKLFGISGKKKLFFSILIAFSTNPAWLSLIGVF